MAGQAGPEIPGYEPGHSLGRDLQVLTETVQEEVQPVPTQRCPIGVANQGARIEEAYFWRRGGLSFLAEYSTIPIDDAGAITETLETFRADKMRSTVMDALRLEYEGLERYHEKQTAELSAVKLRLEAEIVQRTRAEEDRDQLERERGRLAAVVQRMPSGVVIAEAPSGRLLHYNEVAARLLHHPLIPPEAVYDSAFDSAIHPDGRPYRPEEYPIARALRGEVIKEENLRCRHSGSAESYLSVNASPIRDESGQIVAAVSTFHDVSDRGRAELSRAELLRRLVTSQEEERHRIARELHDQMGQHLTAFLLDLEALKRQTTDPTAASAVQRLRDLADQMGQDVHRIAMELRPTALDDWGLQIALRNYVGEWSRRSRIMVQLHCTGMERCRLPSEFETALYRVTQEALTNVLKHSQASRVSVIVERRDDEALAIIEDNGRGFEVEAVVGDPDARCRLGLLGMEERVVQVGGTLEVESTPGRGTSLFIRIPLRVSGRDDHA